MLIVRQENKKVEKKEDFPYLLKGENTCVSVLHFLEIFSLNIEAMNGAWARG
jgi:hypothetical protein